jgi:hypothetical protein
MSNQTRVTVGGTSRALTTLSRHLGLASAWCMLGLAACGGAAKPADTPGTCPEGSVLKGDDCVPQSTAAGKPTGDEDSPKGNTKGEAKHASAASAGQSGGGDLETGGGGSYDKDAVEAQLRRAAKQVKDNCGSASDEEGNKGGPWGSTSAGIVLGRNGHVLEVKVPAPYSGKPVGDCVVNSFKRIQFPPYAGSSDATVSWDVQIVEPKHK